MLKDIGATGLCSFVLAVAGAILYAASAVAAPHVPADDSVVLERLPERGDPGLRELKRMRAALAASPGNLEVATLVARRAIDASRTTGDPRFLGQAQAALSPWWAQLEAPPTVVLLRATIRQSQHDFDRALADLDRLLTANPRAAQARLTRATVLTVVGRFAEAQSDCRQLATLTSPLVIAGCMAAPGSLSGEAELAYARLMQGLDQPGADPGMLEWAQTLAAEIAQRRGDDVAAERHFAAALALDASDAYLKAPTPIFFSMPIVCAKHWRWWRPKRTTIPCSFAAFSPNNACPISAKRSRSNRDEMGGAIRRSAPRGDSLHRREEARFRLEAEGDGRGALLLARENWKVQREPADLRILVDAARATNDTATLRLASDWIAQTHLDDKAVVAALATTDDPRADDGFRVAVRCRRGRAQAQRCIPDGAARWRGAQGSMGHRACVI